MLQGPPLLLRESWQAEVVGSRVVRAGLLGAVKWAAPEAKAIAGSTPFALQVSRGRACSEQAWHQRASTQLARTRGGAASRCTRRSSLAACCLLPACLVTWLCLHRAQPPEGADPRVRTALKCCLAAERGTKHGPAIGTFLADTLSPLPAAAALLQVRGPARAAAERVCGGAAAGWSCAAA